MFDVATARRFLALDPRARRQPRCDGGIRRVPRPQAARSSRCCASWDSRHEPRMKIATWNVNSLRVRLPHLKDWLAANPVDAIVLQETKLPDADFPKDDLQALGLHVAFSGQRTYNGVAILARSRAGRRGRGHSGFRGRAEARARGHARRRARHRRLRARTDRRSARTSTSTSCAGSRRCATTSPPSCERHPQLVVLGDFNIAPEDRDVHDPKAWEGSVHVSQPERAALQVAAGARARGLLPAVRAAGEGLIRGGTTG